MTDRIVVLDGYTTSPDGDPSWDALGELGELTVHDRTPPNEVVARAAGAGIVITNKTLLPAAVLDELPDLRYVGLLSTGTNVIDLDAARQRDITVCNVPAYGTASVAQHVFALLLELVNHVGEHDRQVKRGVWAAGPDFCFTVAPMVELAGKTLGIVGMGDIGQAVGRIGHAMGMHVAAHSRTEKSLDYPVAWRTLEQLLGESDVVSLHCPLTDATQGLINDERLSLMKPGAYLINTGRGPLLDEPAVAAALVDGRLGGAGLDVLSSEPPNVGNPLVSAPRCVVTPHVAWATAEARRRLLGVVVENIRAWRRGEPQNGVT
jgi:glycerate dehydrogenase